MEATHGGEAGSGAWYDPEGQSELARADEPGLTKYLNATELEIGSIIALWRPDGTLIACTNGLTQPAS